MPERWVIENYHATDKIERFLDLINGIKLTWLEAAVLLQNIYQGFSFADVADNMNVKECQVDKAYSSLIRKVAMALGYITAAGKE